MNDVVEVGVTIVPRGYPTVTLRPSLCADPTGDRQPAWGRFDGTEVRPEHFTDADLLDWARACHRKDSSLAPEALSYWLRYTYSGYTPECEELRVRLARLIG